MKKAKQPKARQGKGKKVLLIAFLIFPLLGFGGAYLAATKGLINVPGVSPKSVSKKDASQDDAKAAAKEEVPVAAKPKVKVQDPKPVEPKKPATPKEDPVKGIEAVADVWSNMKADQLAPIAERYSDKDLASILIMLDAKKTAALLALLKPDRAEKLSREIQRQASIVDPAV